MSAAIIDAAGFVASRGALRFHITHLRLDLDLQLDVHVEAAVLAEIPPLNVSPSICDDAFAWVYATKHCGSA